MGSSSSSSSSSLQQRIDVSSHSTLSATIYFKSLLHFWNTTPKIKRHNSGTCIVLPQSMPRLSLSLFTFYLFFLFSSFIRISTVSNHKKKNQKEKKNITNRKKREREREREVGVRL